MKKLVFEMFHAKGHFVIGVLSGLENSKESDKVRGITCLLEIQRIITRILEHF